MECAICHAVVDPEDADAHLAANHPTPSGGFQFFYDARPYCTDRPSMPVSELLAVVGGHVGYQFYEDRDRVLIPLSHGQAVDLTNGPRWFVSIPSACGN